MRVHFQAPPQLASANTLNSLFEHTRQQFGMQVHFHALSHRPRLLLMVSQHGHCLNDLLFPLEEWQPRGGHPGHREQPRNLPFAGRKLRHPLPPPAAGRRQQRPR